MKHLGVRFDGAKRDDLQSSHRFAIPETPRGVDAAAEDDATVLRPLPTGLQPRSGPAFFEQQRGPGLG